MSSSSEGSSASTKASELEEGWIWVLEELVLLLLVPRSSSRGGGEQPSRKASRGQEVYWINCLSEHKTQEESRKNKIKSAWTVSNPTQKINLPSRAGQYGQEIKS